MADASRASILHRLLHEPAARGLPAPRASLAPMTSPHPRSQPPTPAAFGLQALDRLPAPWTRSPETALSLDCSTLHNAPLIRARVGVLVRACSFFQPLGVDAAALFLHLFSPPVASRRQTALPANGFTCCLSADTSPVRTSRALRVVVDGSRLLHLPSRARAIPASAHLCNWQQSSAALRARAIRSAL